jgi:hypothetical protein
VIGDAFANRCRAKDAATTTSPESPRRSGGGGGRGYKDFWKQAERATVDYTRNKKAAIAAVELVCRELKSDFAVTEELVAGMERAAGVVCDVEKIETADEAWRVARRIISRCDQNTNWSISMHIAFSETHVAPLSLLKILPLTCFQSRCEKRSSKGVTTWLY